MIALLLVGCAHDRIAARELASVLESNPEKYVVVDVRSDGEWSGSHIVQATHLAWPGVKERAGEIVATAEQTVVLVCLTGHRSRWAMESVRAAVPAEVIDLRGGMMAWWSAGLPTVQEP